MTERLRGMPRWVKRHLDWINVPIYVRGRIRITRIDVVLAVLGAVCVGYYWSVLGWLGGLAGGLYFVMMVMIALWLL
jgi:hypothetical protein